MRKLSRRVRDDALALLLQGLSTHEVAGRLNISHMSVDRIRRQASIELPSCPAGRPKRFSPEEERCIVREVETSRCKTASDVRRKLFHDTPTPPSLSTILVTLHAAGIRRFRRRKKPRLIKRHIRERLNFARQHAGWAVGDWNRVVWSDETKINLDGSDGDVFYYGRKGGDLVARNLQQRVPRGGGHIMLDSWRGASPVIGVSRPRAQRQRIPAGQRLKTHLETCGKAVQ